MSSREQCERLLETIDAVLAECAKDPRRRPARPSTRPAWPGPSWSQDQQAVGTKGHPDSTEQRTS